MARPVDTVPMPARIAALPRNPVGYPIPWFVPELGGVRDFRIASADLMFQAVRDSLCWTCGGQLGPVRAAVIGPMCVVNRVSSEPGQHRECALYAVQVCPFLTTPQMVRREGGKPEVGMVAPAGHMVERNPGVAAVWVTFAVTPFRPPGDAGLLFRLGNPIRVSWFRQGRPATRGEVLDSIHAGVPQLMELCDQDDNPAQSRRDVRADLVRALQLVPA